MKPICERVNGTLRRDPLDRVLIIGERHLALVLREYAAHYNGRRPHPSPGDGGPRIGRRSQRQKANDPEGGRRCLRGQGVYRNRLHHHASQETARSATVHART
jgi:putative transposase